MKRIMMIMSLLMAMNVYSQECDEYIKTVKDDMTDDSYIGLAEIIQTKTTLGKDVTIDAFLVNGTIAMYFEVDGILGCVDEGDEVILLMNDDTKLKMKHMGKFNCKGRSVLYLDGRFGTKKQLETLISNGIKKIRTYNSESYCDIEINEIDSAFLMNGIKCLSEQE